MRKVQKKHVLRQYIYWHSHSIGCYQHLIRVRDADKMGACMTRRANVTPIFNQPYNNVLFNKLHGSNEVQSFFDF